MDGFILLHRKIKDNWIFQRSDYFHWFVIILFKCNFKDNNEFLFEGEFMTVKRGQFVTSFRNLAKELPNCSVQQIRTFLKLLQKSNVIETKSIKKATQITVLKYDSYQGEQHNSNTIATQLQHSSNTVATTIEIKKKNDNKENKENIYLNYSFFKDEFKEIWVNEFIPIKKKKKASISDRAIKSQLEKIKKFSNGNYITALEILEKSVNSGYTDFYELKNNTICTQKKQSGVEIITNRLKQKYGS